jgi:hypothetical protein
VAPVEQQRERFSLLRGNASSLTIDASSVAAANYLQKLPSPPSRAWGRSIA